MVSSTALHRRRHHLQNGNTNAVNQGLQTIEFLLDSLLFFFSFFFVCVKFLLSMSMF